MFSYLHANVLLLDYRGYGNSSGTPSERGLQQDALAALAFVQSRPDLDPRRVFLYGASLGGAVALWLATEVGARAGVAGVVVENTFTSIPDLATVLVRRNAQRLSARLFGAGGQVGAGGGGGGGGGSGPGSNSSSSSSSSGGGAPFGASSSSSADAAPAGASAGLAVGGGAGGGDGLGWWRPLHAVLSLIVTSQWRSLQRLPALRIPILLVSGQADELVPPAHMRALAAAVPSDVACTLHAVPAGEHNTTFYTGGAAYYAAFGKFLEAACRARGRPLANW